MQEEENFKLTQNCACSANFRSPVRVTDDSKRISLPVALTQSKFHETIAHMPRKKVSYKVALLSPCGWILAVPVESVPKLLSAFRHSIEAIP